MSIGRRQKFRDLRRLRVLQIWRRSAGGGIATASGTFDFGSVAERDIQPGPGPTTIGLIIFTQDLRPPSGKQTDF